MKNLAITVLLLSLVMLAGCSKGTQPSASIEPVVSTSPAVVETPAETPEPQTSAKESDAPDFYSKDSQIVMVCGEPVRWNGYTAIEPECDYDIYSMSFSDFGSFFDQKFEVSYDSYKIMEGEMTETSVVHIHSDNPGPTIYIVGAVHGDERAAWFTAVLMRQATISCGDLYVLAPANANGARNVKRYVTANQDLNRSFPGDPAGNEAERLADAIFSDIEDKKPSLVLDLHEAIIYSNTRDFLGSTYIFTKLDGMDELFFDLLFATEDGTICHNEFGFTGPGPEGSVNCEVTNLLGIPTITVETFRGFNMDRRVYDQLDTVQFVLNYLGMR